MFRNWIPAVCWAFLILILYGTPGDDFPDLESWNFFRIDKVAHFAVFAIFYVTLKVALLKSGKRIRVGIKAGLIALVYGISLEFIQGSVFVGRYFEWSDMLANIIGVFIGDVIFRLIYRKVYAA
jgi:VanZ family protein